MKLARILAVTTLLGAPVFAAQTLSTYTGVITDTMCGADHSAMKVTPDAKCVRGCVGRGKTFQYALATGDRVYKLSDQQTPEKFAGAKVKVTGVLYEKTNIIKVEKIEPAASTR